MQLYSKNKVTVSYDSNPIDDEDEDDDAKSDDSDNGESSAKEDILPHEIPFVPKFGLVDASDNDEAAFYGALP